MKSSSLHPPSSDDASITADPGVVRETIPWLIRIPEVFEEFTKEILLDLEATPVATFGSEYHSVKMASGQKPREGKAGLFISWNLPIHHSWPCNPQKMDGFVEKAAQTMLHKFSDQLPVGILMGQLHPSSPNPYYRSLASNLRGRTLQLFPKQAGTAAENLQADDRVLYVLVGKEGLFCGMQTPREANGFYAGGTKFISQSSPITISRAGAKVAEALHYLRLHRPPLPIGSHWLELGASPGGMTAELLARDYRVTAVDRAPLDPRLQGHHGLSFVHADAASFRPRPGAAYDALLSDLNGDAQTSFQNVLRLSTALRKGALVIFTLKVTNAPTLSDMLLVSRQIAASAAEHGLQLIANTHLTYNRREFTLFFEKGPSGH